MTSKDLSETENLEWFYKKYADTVKRGKPNARTANQLKLMIDVIQVYHMVK